MINITSDIKLDFKDVLIQPQRSHIKSRSEINLYQDFTFRHSRRTYKGIPIMASNMNSIGTFELAKALSKHGLFTVIHKYHSVNEWKKFAVENPNCLDNVAVTSGLGDDDVQQLRSILVAVPAISFICLDIANGHSLALIECLRKVRAWFPNHTIIVGNVVTVEAVEELILTGADIVKVGCGGGSVCTTRIKTGIGYPQLSAIIECSKVAHGLDAHIISDGGCVCSGDIVKAFGGGADFVMIGGMLAGHDECIGDLIEANGDKFKIFYGNSSRTSMEIHCGGVAEYRAAEGKAVKIPNRGPIKATIFDILGGLRSACTYVGASQLGELSSRTSFVRCTQQFNSIYGGLNTA